MFIKKKISPFFVMASRQAIVDRILQLARNVHTVMGSHHPEAIYHACMKLALLKNTPYRVESKFCIPIHLPSSKNQIGQMEADLVVGQDHDVVVELKASKQIEGLSQLRKYMRFYPFKEGLVLNFGRPTLAVNQCAALPAIAPLVAFTSQLTNLEGDWFHAISKAAEQVYAELGNDHSVTVYQKAMVSLLQQVTSIHVQPNFHYGITYQGVQVGHDTIDILINNTCAVMIKNNKKFQKAAKYDTPQKPFASNMLINFGPEKMEWCLDKW